MKLSNLAKIFKALSNEQRLKLFRMVYDYQEVNMKPEETLSCCPGMQKTFTKACACMNISRSTISHHLKELQNADLITCTRNGQTYECKVNDEVLEEVKKFLE